MKRKDIVLIALALLVALALYGGNRLLADKNADTVVVTVDGVEKLRCGTETIHSSAPVS